MRIVLANPHSYVYGKTVLNFLLGRKNFMKYSYFIDYYLNDRTKETAFYIDGTRSSFHVIGLSFPFFPKFFVFIELIVWMLCNHINPLRHKVYFHADQLDEKKDILVDFARSIGQTGKKKELDKYSGLVMIFFTHYFVRAREISEYLMKVSHSIIAAENDLCQVAYFQKYFPAVKALYQLPFAIGDRYVTQNNFAGRINKCLAVGSLSMIDDQAFTDFFGSSVLHPMRKLLCDQAADYPNEIDSLILPMQDAVSVQNNLKIPRSLNFLKRCFPYVLLETIFGTKQSEYFKFNIVEKYNAYKMFICPEEIAGLPSINVFEGMACGAAFIGIDDPMYTNLGLRPGVHYITYEKGDINDLISKIGYYQDNPEKLEKIAVKGGRYVRDNFNKKSVARTLWNDLEIISNRFESVQKVEIMCSFKKG